MIERLRRRLAHYGLPPSAAWEALSAAFTAPRSAPAGEEIISQFSQPGASTLMLSGLGGRVVTLRGGAQQITALHLPGDFVDLHSFLLHRLDHSMVAFTDVSVTTIAHADLKRLIDACPELGRGLWFLTLVDAAIHRQWLGVVGRREALGRAAHLLCELYLRLEDVGLAQDRRFELGLTQAVFGDALCVSAVHANRTIQALRQQGLLRWSRRTVEILDWDALARVGEFDPTYLQLDGPRPPG